MFYSTNLFTPVGNLKVNNNIITTYILLYTIIKYLLFINY